MLWSSFLQTTNSLLSLECILRKLHVNCHNAIVNILITIVRVFLVSKKNSKPLKSTHFPLPRHIAFIIEPPCIFLAHFLGASVLIVLKGWLKGYKWFQRRVVSPSAWDDFPGYRIFVVSQTGRAVHIPANDVSKLTPRENILLTQVIFYTRWKKSSPFSFWPIWDEI